MGDGIGPSLEIPFDFDWAEPIPNYVSMYDRLTPEELEELDKIPLRERHGPDPAVD